MTAQSLLKEARQLSPEERVKLAHSILKSIDRSSKTGPLTHAQKQELQRRKLAFQTKPSATVTWDELKRKLRPKQA